MCDELILTITNQNEAKDTRNENGDQISIVNEKDKKIEKQSVEESTEESYKNSKGSDITDDLIKINTDFHVKPQTVWVQYIGDPGLGGGVIPGGGGGGGFSYDPYTRNYFVRYVLTIVFIMILMTSIITAVVYMTDSLRKTFLQYNMAILISSMIVMVMMSYCINCSPCTRIPPCNFICLLIAVIAMSLLCAAITARYKTQLVVFALLATLITVFICTLLACSNFDFTAYMIYAIALSVAFAAVVLVVSIAMLVMQTRFPVLSLVILVVGTLINVAFLIMELQMILGGRSIEINESDYALAAYLLYTSTVNMFLTFIQMFGIIDQLAN